MNRVFVGFGSNLGDRRAFLLRALQELGKVRETTVVGASSVYQTEPVGEKVQPEFLNMVAELRTSLRPVDLLRSMKTIEKNLGRSSTKRWGPREIDLDLLYFGDLVLNDEGLQIPHPENTNRRFVLIPMKEIAEDFIDPLRMLSMVEMLKRCTDTSAVRKAASDKQSSAAHHSPSSAKAS
jgi:2-amino-4-hydroxy-6-hydroxymethyldihydropteridine diphosphokinase